jgi:hypothetical protein
MIASPSPLKTSCGMNPKVLYWWQTLLLVVVAMVLAAIITGCLALIADYVFWD